MLSLSLFFQQGNERGGVVNNFEPNNRIVFEGKSDSKDSLFRNLSSLHKLLFFCLISSKMVAARV